jgi:ankyrin repeat protein
MYDNTGKSIKCLTNFRAHFDYADNKGNYPISTAVQTENAFAVKELLKLGYYQFEAFYSSLYKEDIEIAKSFFPFVSDINEKHITGYTALITACKIGNYELIKLLLENGADPNITDNDNQTAIETLIKNNHLKCIGLFKADALVRKSDQLHIFKHRLPSLFQ